MKYPIMTMRTRLMAYLAAADDSKVKAVYTLLEKEIENDLAFVLSDEQLQILDRERELHLSGKSKSYGRTDARKIIKGEIAF